MKPITECSREERLERALLAIECLTWFFDESKCMTAEELSRKVYYIAHTAPGKCGNPHVDWLQTIEEIEKAGKEANIYDVEKTLQRIHKVDTTESPS